MSDRADGRTGLLRPSRIIFKVAARANGSAEVYMGHTHVIASIFGASAPKFSRQQTILGSFLEININLLSSSKQNKDGSAYIESNLRRGLAKIIDQDKLQSQYASLHIMVLNDDGSLDAATLNAAFAAVIDAGLPIKSDIDAINHPVWAVSACQTSNGDWFIDPTRAEEMVGHVQCTRFVGSQAYDFVSVNMMENGESAPNQTVHNLVDLEQAADTIYTQAMEELPWVHRLALESQRK